MENEPEPVVVLGMGSIEQHGPHLPLGMDSLGAKHFVYEVAKRTNSVCFNPCWPGYSPHHMGYRGTVTLKEDTLHAVYMDTIARAGDPVNLGVIITGGGCSCCGPCRGGGDGLGSSGGWDQLSIS